jgi:hypothetical protein
MNEDSERASEHRDDELKRFHQKGKGKKKEMYDFYFEFRIICSIVIRVKEKSAGMEIGLLARF